MLHGTELQLSLWLCGLVLFVTLHWFVDVLLYGNVGLDLWRVMGHGLYLGFWVPPRKLWDSMWIRSWPISFNSFPAHHSTCHILWQVIMSSCFSHTIWLTDAFLNSVIVSSIHVSICLCAIFYVLCIWWGGTVIKTYHLSYWLWKLTPYTFPVSLLASINPKFKR